MSDNINVTPGTGKTVATDDISGVQYQRIKVTLGDDGINEGDISSTNPMPVTISSPAPLPSGAATASNQTDGSQKSQVVDGSGNVWGPRTGVSSVNYMPVINLEAGSDGSAIPLRALFIAGSDGTNLRNLSVDTAGKLNINNISGSISLPTGASTSANQSLEIASLSSIDGKLNSLGQKTMAGSVPVVIASDQSAIPVTGTITTSPNVNIHDGSGNSITSQINGSQRALDVGINVAGIQIDPRQIRTLTSGDVVTANQGTSPWVISGTVTANAGTNLNTSALALDTTVTALQVSQGSTTSGEKGTLIMGAVTTASPTYTTGQTSPLSLDTSGNLRIAGTVTITPTGTQNVNVSQINGNTTLTGNGVTGTGSQRVTIASDNTAFTVKAQLQDNAGNGITSTSFNSKQSLDVRSNNGFSTNSNTRVAVTTASTQLLAANTNRRYAYIFNQSGATLFLKFGDPAVVNQGIRLPNFAMYEINADNLWTGTVNAISSAGTNTLDIFEGTT